MARLALLIALCVSLSACGGTDASPTSAGPTSPGASVFSLIGTVIGYDGPVVGASVTIMDGIHAGQTRTTNAAGNYSFTDLTPSSFTLQAAAIPTEGYLPQNQAVNLTANQSVTFHLSDH
jgi:hypothetical protein